MPGVALRPRPQFQAVAGGRSTRDDVLRVLCVLRHPPSVPVPPGPIVYPYLVDTIYWFPCYSQPEWRYLRVEFDDQGKVRAYKVTRTRPGPPALR